MHFAAKNLYSCGFYGDSMNECTRCAASALRAQQKKSSGMLGAP